MTTTRSRFVPIVLALAASHIVLTGCASTGTPQNASVEPTGLQKEEASIPFARMDTSIREWQANGQDGIWVQDGLRNWYYGKTLGPCFGLDLAIAVGFEPGAGGQLDKFSSILIPREKIRCPFTSFVRSDPPPPKKGKDTAPAK